MKVGSLLQRGQIFTFENECQTSNIYSSMHLEMGLALCCDIVLCCRSVQPASSCTSNHGLSQQGVWVSFWTPKPLKSTPQDTREIS